jgi:hypothetical protein
MKVRLPLIVILHNTFGSNFGHLQSGKDTAPTIPANLRSQGHMTALHGADWRQA